LHGFPRNDALAPPISNQRRLIMTWTKPEFIDWRFGFEITLYIANR
jgi:coenzyme PQQ precursor peptide PqqA